MNIIRKAKIAADKRSIDAYGRSVEIAIANYLLDNGDFPTSINDLTIEYSGDEVVCSITQLNPDSSIYLKGCTVGGRNIDYTYGSDKTPGTPTYTVYSIGDEVTYNNVDYYVIKDSNENDSTVTLLKAEPLTTEEVTLYGGVGTENNHVNRFIRPSESCYQSTCDQSGYGAMLYYSSSTCGWENDDFSSMVQEGCLVDYEQSDVKYVVDNWAIQNATLGIQEARLITIDEIRELGYEYKQMECVTCGKDWVKRDDMPNWLNNTSYSYWTMSPDGDSSTAVYIMRPNGITDKYSVGFFYSVAGYYGGLVRPVITISKNLLDS